MEQSCRKVRFLMSNNSHLICNHSIISCISKYGIIICIVSRIHHEFLNIDRIITSIIWLISNLCFHLVIVQYLSIRCALFIFLFTNCKVCIDIRDPAVYFPIIQYANTVCYCNFFFCQFLFTPFIFTHAVNPIFSVFWCAHPHIQRSCLRNDKSTKIYSFKLCPLYFTVIINFYALSNIFHLYIVLAFIQMQNRYITIPIANQSLSN